MSSTREPEQPSLFEAESFLEPSVESWPRIMARRMQSLLMSYPIHQTAARGESHHHPEWAGQNFTFLALQIFDSVFARMAPGLGRGATRQEIIHDLTPLALARQPDLTEEQVEAMVDFILDRLMNEGKGVFESECVWLDESAAPKPFPFRFGLLKAYHDPESDQFIIRATTEAIHLYLRMLDHPIQDEQISNLFVLYEQVRRGRISRSRREAERTMLLSLQYERHIEDLLRAARRDVRGVDWARDAAPKIEEAHLHVKRLIREQGKVLAELKRELQRSEDLARVKSIRELIDALELCQRRHMALQKRILAAGPGFLQEQAYQRFRNMARSPMPDLNQQVFLPALTIEQNCFRPIVARLYETALGPRIHRFLDLEVFIDRLLLDELEPTPKLDEEELEERTPVETAYDPVHDQVEEKIADALASVDDTPTRLSDVLGQGRAEGLSLDELAAVGMTVLHSYHAKSDLLGFTVQKDGALLEDADFQGDDLLVARRSTASFNANGA